MCVRYRIFYFAEAITPLDPGLMKRVADEVHIPLASGERLYTRWGFKPFLENGSLKIIQPDLDTCGGVTEGKKICDMAATYISRPRCPTSSSMNTTASILIRSTSRPACATTSPRTAGTRYRSFRGSDRSYPSMPSSTRTRSQSSQKGEADPQALTEIRGWTRHRE